MSGVRSNSFSSQSFEDWRDINFDIVQHLDFFQQPKSSSATLLRQFQVKKAAMHQRALESLKNYNISVDQAETAAEKLKQQIEANPPVTQTSIDFDNNNDIMKLRQLQFLKKYAWKNQLKQQQKIIMFFATKKAQIQRLTQFLLGKSVPSLLAIKIKDSFYEMDPGENKYQKRNEIIHTKIKLMKQELSKVPYPLWVTNFEEFFSKLVNQAAQVIDPELFYFGFIPDEINISRYLFSSNSKNGRAIDYFIALNSQNSFSEFSDKIIEFCAALVPQQACTTPKDQSISLLLFFRAIMDRVYETNTALFSTSEFYAKYPEIHSTKMSGMTLPKGMSPPGDMEESARECFLRAPLYRKASETFLLSFFTVNPIDGLYYIHVTMSDIHRAAISALVGHEPTPDELKQILGFDDLFSLFFGVLLASDCPDPFQVHSMMKTFAPKSCLSPMFEYANANLEALVLHCGKLCA
ncbi:hypothetical protein TVAG_287540 [Trichomonas vaginalis G3]|uniref:VPS9 domain-containing protein n=1 Tax=Trichomonas vaginalis (strain ATCC PRA-98 / G3) TaxID=412133 RepID=A2FKF3_TRIV3|nr:hypothetical protein TVAGG3_0247060 [Trichomonas vaginalis G3]EAX94619.1 hypothetical protein TVAG_287540 [Trichomonas vaginalis G3]KAI5553733.1 hypothetical protein TVAGG3_0247060 [Trichomonas vaginalis G3]|eukprot:XP_001307549.1 hypothetical protein [Trichomonas vaginalis G3]